MKNNYFEYIKAMTMNPFAQQLANASSAPFKSEAASSLPNETIAGGPWWKCEVCCDPGPDPFPEEESRQSV